VSQRRLTALSALLLVAAFAALALWRARTGRGPGVLSESAVVRLEPATGAPGLARDREATRLLAITADLPSTLAWPLRVPERARLRTHLSFARQKADALAGLRCQARLEVARRGEATTVLARRDVEPAASWLPIEADLARVGGREVEVRLAVECPSAAVGPSGRGAVLWAVPEVYQPRAERERNLLLVTIDTQRPDHLGAYGYPRPTSPHLDRLARRGLVFLEAETVQSATWPALASLHTSLYPSAHGVTRNGQRLPDGFVTLARLLHAKGFSTSAFLANMKRGNHAGFAKVYWARGGDQDVEDEDATEAAIAQLRADRERRFFLWLHLLSPHASYRPPPPFDAAFTRPRASSVSGEIAALNAIREKKLPLGEADLAHVRGLYDGEVAWVDSLVGRLLDALRDLDLERSTLVVFTADHGEDLHEHNRYFFHSPSVYGSSLRIPLVLAMPGVLPEGSRVDHLASLVDVAPTVLGLLGLPAVSQFQGVNLLPGRAVPARPARSMLHAETHGRIFSLRTAEWRFIYNPTRLHPGAPGGPYPIGEVELYDQRTDRRESRNLAAERSDLVSAFTRDVLAFRSRYLVPRAPEAGVDPETLSELRALGYVAGQ
jgi:arylsulfatase A-like enzyme